MLCPTASWKISTSMPLASRKDLSSSACGRPCISNNNLHLSLSTSPPKDDRTIDDRHSRRNPAMRADLPQLKKTPPGPGRCLMGLLFPTVAMWRLGIQGLRVQAPVQG